MKMINWILIALAVAMLVSGAMAADSGSIQMRAGANITGTATSYLHNFANGTAAQDAVTYSQTIGSSGIYNVKNYGATGDGVSDDADDIQEALNASYAAGGGIVYIPAGNYSLQTRQSNTAAFLVPKSNVHIVGAGMGVTKLRVANNKRTSALACVILYDFSTTVVSHFSVSDLTFDGNAQNNRLGVWTSYQDRVGAENCDNVTIERCEFDNITGSHCIVLVGFERQLTSRNAVVRDCRINDVSTAAIDDSIPDFTAIYVAVNDAIIEDNVLSPKSPLSSSTGIEFHASVGSIRRNIIRYFSNGIYAQSDGVTIPTEVSAVDISDNIVEHGRGLGIKIFGYANKRYDLINIAHNILKMDATTNSNGIEHDSSFTSALNTRKLRIVDNTIIFAPDQNRATQRSTGIAINHVEGLNIQRNYIHNSTCEGIMCYFSNAIPLPVVITENEISRFGTNTVSGQEARKAGIRISSFGAVPMMVVSRNQLYDDTPSTGPTWGIYFNDQATVGHYTVDNDIIGPGDPIYP